MTVMVVPYRLDHTAGKQAADEDQYNYSIMFMRHAVFLSSVMWTVFVHGTLILPVSVFPLFMFSVAALFLLPAPVLFPALVFLPASVFLATPITIIAGIIFDLPNRWFTRPCDGRTGERSQNRDSENQFAHIHLPP